MRFSWLSIVVLFTVIGMMCPPWPANGAGRSMTPVKRVLPSTLTLRDANGRRIELLDADYTVFCFLGTECPLAKLYGSRLQQIADQFSMKGVQFIGVNSNVQDSPREIQRYAKDHLVKFAIAKDVDQSVADAFGASRTPEVFVVAADGSVRYQGRIDDQYEPGVTRAKPTAHDLRNALEELTSGRAVTVAKTKGVGCLITRFKKTSKNDQGDSKFTFTRDIAPILNQHCVECHRDGEIGPMSLTDYDEVVGWGQMILEVIDNRRMPPWHADPSIGHFKGQRILPQQARDAIANWVNGGMPKGDVAALPSQPEFLSGWHLKTEPEFQYEMGTRPFEVPAEGTVDYQYFVVDPIGVEVDPQWTTDRWVRAAQVLPGDPSVVHHCIVFVRPPDDRAFHGIGWLGAYVPGQRTIELPPGHARLVPAGSKFVFQMHYTTNGRPTTDRTKVGVWTIPEEEVTHQVITELAIDHEFEIPPGDPDFRVNLSADSFPSGGRMLGIAPHMHLRGKAFELEGVFRNGTRERLLSVPEYDFNWQHYYEFAEPIELDSVDSLRMSVDFDNSRGNPFNPDPKEYVFWGDQTWEEMALAFYDVAVSRESQKRQHRGSTKPSPAQVRAYRERVQKLADQFLDRMDANQNGVVEREETSIAFRDFAFRRFDRNRDRILDRDEIERAASSRTTIEMP